MPGKSVRPTGLGEAEGRAVLRELFTRAGFEIVEDYPFNEDGVEVSLDGFDPVRRVGYEFMTREAGDFEDFTGHEIGELMRRNQSGNVHILLVDGEGRPDKTMLEYLARKFLKQVIEIDKTQV
jgi:hypothetical protein